MTDIEKDGIMEEVHTVMLSNFDRSVDIGTSSVIGGRNYQQDAIKTDDYYAYAENGRMISVLCDGMGGLSGGEKASAACTSIVYDTFHSDEPFPSIPAFYKTVIRRSDDEVSSMRTDEGEQMIGSGTTMVSVTIEEDNLYWASVGDSHAYILRGTDMLCITKDHNYLMLLNEKVKRGEITQEAANSNPKKEALVSYIGIGGVPYIDMNNKGFHLQDGDCIVLCSDGLYRSLTDEEIKQVVLCFKNEAQQAAVALTTLALNKHLRHQDNTSVVVIAYKDSGSSNI